MVMSRIHRNLLPLTIKKKKKIPAQLPLNRCGAIKPAPRSYFKHLSFAEQVVEGTSRSPREGSQEASL